ncbi:hypothetical protein GA707_10925 [Nostocoides sp. F2B08]|uniref:hypothetical protein n=1 Tax=Nostocoides sp. F2B08 TaxID=2653936 RepID=UPI00126381BF|nr:hypothetical protein [Tetrasphaera sp. F2B08]KAB7743973.1 hypothetical protein GA707_10925 [Tetrasphaera sp. F2B08]
MRPVPLVRLAPVVGLAVLVAACGSATESPEEPAATSSVASESPSRTVGPTQTPTGPIATISPGMGSLERVTVTGVLEEGVESGCVVITDVESGQVYTVTGTGLPERLGERVTVTGTVDPDMVSYCQQGAIILVDEVTPAPPQ